ncbi:hypothetical protein pb186bvf_002362 [Paramecium bursaria]
MKTINNLLKIQRKKYSKILQRNKELHHNLTFFICLKEYKFALIIYQCLNQEILIQNRQISEIILQFKFKYLILLNLQNQGFFYFPIIVYYGDDKANHVFDIIINSIGLIIKS